MNQAGFSHQGSSLGVPRSNTVRALFDVHRLSLGFLFLLTVPIGAAAPLLVVGNIGGFEISGWMWFLYLTAAGVLVGVELLFAKRVQVALPYGPWLLWYGFVWCSLLWCDSFGRRNVQDALQISMPLVIGVAAALFIKTERDLKFLTRAFAVSLLIVCIHVGRSVISGADAVSGARVLSMTAVLIGCLSISHCPRRLLVPFAAWATCLVVTFLVGSRTATALLLLIPILNPLVRGIVWRIGAVAGMAALGYLLILYPHVSGTILPFRVRHSDTVASR